MSRFAVTLFGEDAPGIIATVTRELAAHGHNLESCSSTTVRGHTAMILVVLEAPEAEPPLDKLLGSVQKMLIEKNLNVGMHVATANQKEPAPGKRYAIVFHGTDRPGLVGGVSEVFAGHGVNVVDLQTSVIGGPDAVYLMRFEVEIPEGMISAVETALAAKTQKLGIQIASLDRVPTGQVAASVQIKDVQLKSSFFQLDGTMSDEDLAYYRTGYFAEIKEDQKLLVVEAGFQLVFRKQDDTLSAVANATSLANQPLKASALFQINYSFLWEDSSPGRNELQTFAEVNAIFNAWPYWRQLLHSMLPSMGVQKLVIPVFRFPFPARS